MPFIDPFLARAVEILKPEVPISSLFVTVDRAGQTRVREIESLGAFATYSGKFLPQVHADVPASVLPALVRSGAVREAWYDAPHYAFAAPRNPLRSSSAEIQARLDARTRRIGPTHLPSDPGGGSHLRSYLGAMGPLSVPHESLAIGLDDVRKHVRADEANARGATGKGVLVAVLDTGADGTHPMLEGKIRKHLSMVQEESGRDGNGHGSWCCSCIAGIEVEYQGKVEQLRGRVLSGMAPEAELLDVKVLTSEGAGSTSGVIQGIEAAVEEGADILSMSLGSLLGQAGLGPDAIWWHGV